MDELLKIPGSMSSLLRTTFIHFQKGYENQAGTVSPHNYSPHWTKPLKKMESGKGRLMYEILSWITTVSFK